MWERASRLKCDARGAVAPTIALSLFALVAAGGIAFDYARMASLDTELQNAADQAALAAVTQLDGKEDACARAAAAAKDMIVNITLMANDGSDDGVDVTIADEPDCDANGFVRFYQDIEKTEPADEDSNAKFVEIEVNPRESFFALTPVVAAFSSGDIRAIAFAGMSSAICKVPPLMMCNPRESADPDFTVADYIGKGIRLVGNDGGGFYGPGTFGFLDVGAGNGASTLRAELAEIDGPGDCLSATGVDIEPGNIITVRDALNTRFDVQGSGLNKVCNPDSNCPPSANSRKDLLKGNAGGQNNCNFQTGNGNVGWKLPATTAAYLPTSTTPSSDTTNFSGKAPMGHPRDICHAVSVTGSCTNGRVGDGVWDRFAYFRTNSVNYSTITTVAAMNTFLNATFGKTNPSRYEVYQWEMDNASTRLQPQAFGPQRTAYGEALCTTPGIEPDETNVDRRVLSVAVINCDAEDVGSNSDEVPVKKWVDIFLVEPSVPRPNTENSDIYVEIIGQTLNATDEGAVQLIQKSVPVLIE